MGTASGHRFHVLLCGVALLTAAADLHAAPVVDGILDAIYGAPLSVQTTQTSFGDYAGEASPGSELDAAYVRVEDGKLFLFIACSLNRFYSEFLYPVAQLHVFVDTRSGGQNILRQDNSSPQDFVTLQSLAGLTFDSEFAPDYWLGVGRGSSAFPAYFAELPSASDATGYFLGQGVLGPPGTLSGAGAVNPFGILASFDRSNLGGVDAGCNASSGSEVTSGLEWSVPLAAIGDPTGPFRICVLLARPSGLAIQVSNQCLGPIPPGTCSLGLPSAVDLSSVPGPQYFNVQYPVAVFPDPQRLGARLSEPTPNPTRGSVQFRLDVPESRHVRVEVVDLGGRRVRLIADGVFASGPHELRWDGLDSSGRLAPAGLYLIVAGSGAERQSRRFVRLR